MGKRRYEQRLRAETAEQTRVRILDALYERLRDAPSEPVSVDEIARRARVARSTVYLVFGSRSGLFDALTDHLVRGPGLARIGEAVRHPDPRETMRGGLEGGVRMYAAHRDVLRVLYSMAKLDPDGGGRALAASERDRAAAIATLGRRLEHHGLLRPGVTAERAEQVIWILASFDAYDLLTTGRDLSPEAAAEILIEAAENALLR